MEAPAVARRLLELRARARVIRDQRREQDRYRTDPWYWLCRCVWTEDPHDNCYKEFPGNHPWGKYLAHDVALYLDPDAHIVIAPKARRVFRSWLHIALRVWRAAKFTNQLVLLMARKMGENEHSPGSALEMLKRAKQIIRHLQHDTIRFEEHRFHIDLPDTESRIVAVPSGEDAVIGATPTDIMMDEAATWELMQQTFAVARPTIEDKGKMWLISTVRHGSYFSDLRHDRVGHQIRSEDLMPPQKRPLAEGVVYYRNPGNRCHVLELFPEADPRKRDPAWIQTQTTGMSTADVQREFYLNDDDVFSGTPVFAGVYDDRLMTRHGLRRDPKRPMLRGWDWGFAHPCCVVAQLYEARQLRLFACWLGTNIDLAVFGEQVLSLCQERWPGVPFLDAGDFAGRQRRDTGQASIDLMYTQFGLAVRSQYMEEEVPLGWLRGRMREQFRPGDPCFLVDEHPDTEDLRRGLRSGYVLDKHGKPANDGRYEHMGDALKALKNFAFDVTVSDAEMDRLANRDVIPAKPAW